MRVIGVRSVIPVLTHVLPAAHVTSMLEYWILTEPPVPAVTLRLRTGGGIEENVVDTDVFEPIRKPQGFVEVPAHGPVAH